MTDDPASRKPGFGDLESPFLFVPHGAPEPTEWMRKHPGWVKFPATFVPRPPAAVRTIPGTNRPWPLDKRGQPWPRSRFGQPLRPLDEYPPGVRAPGEGYNGPIADPDQAMRAAMASKDVLAEAAKLAADPDAPVRAYLSAADVWRHPWKYAAWPPAEAAFVRAPSTHTRPAQQTQPHPLLVPIQARRPGGGGPTRTPGGGWQDLTPRQQLLVSRYDIALETLRRLEPINPQAHTLSRPNAPPSEELVTRLEAEVAAARMRARRGESPPSLGARRPESGELGRPRAETAGASKPPLVFQDWDRDGHSTPGQNQAPQSASSTVAFGPYGPDKPDEQWLQGQRYEDASYHGKSAQMAPHGVKSQAPLNGTAALRNSYRLPGNTPRRVGFDAENNQFVVFDATSTDQGLWHGHVRSWEELTPAMKSVLIKNAATNAHGRLRR